MAAVAGGSGRSRRMRSGRSELPPPCFYKDLMSNGHCRIYDMGHFYDALKREERSIYNQNSMGGTATHFSV